MSDIVFPPIEAKVAKIVTPTSMAINAGSNKQVQVNDNVIVYRLEEIYDPDTNELLQTLVLTRLRLRVSSVFAKVSVAEVTDRVSSQSTRDIFTARPLRQMTYATAENAGWVQIDRGEPVRIMRPPPAPEEPPF